VQKIKWITVLGVWLAAGNLLAQAGQQAVETKGAAPRRTAGKARTAIPVEDR
jgi:hypothetical protein